MSYTRKPPLRTAFGYPVLHLTGIFPHARMIRNAGDSEPRFARLFVQTPQFLPAQTFSSPSGLRGFELFDASSITKGRPRLSFGYWWSIGDSKPRFARLFVQTPQFLPAQTFSSPSGLRGFELFDASSITKGQPWLSFGYWWSIGDSEPRFARLFVQTPWFLLAQTHSSPSGLRGSELFCASSITKGRLKPSFCYWWSIGDSNP